MSFSEIASKVGSAVKKAGAAVVAWWNGLDPDTRENVKYVLVGVVFGIPVGIWLA